jgi:hypothetical protein
MSKSMKKHTTIIALLSVPLVTVHQIPVRAQAQAIPAVVGACVAQPIVCSAFAIAAGVWLLTYTDGHQVLCDLKRCYPKPSAPARAQPQPSKIDTSNEPGKREVHWMASPSACRELFNKLRKQGQRLDRWSFRKARMPGSKEEGHCFLFGPDTVNDRFVDYRYNNRNEY